METLLRVPELVAAITPLVGRPVSLREIFVLIATGDVAPFGYVARAPVFTLSQIADVARTVGNLALAESGQPQGGELCPH